MKTSRELIRPWLPGAAAVAALLFGAGCGAPEIAADPEVDATRRAEQLDPGMKSYGITQNGVLVAAAWAGPIAGGAAGEYWVSTPRYQQNSARTLTASSQSCADFKRTVCSGAFAGATYYRAVYSQTTLNCALPPGPCRVGGNSSSFLGAGTWRTANGAGMPFATTYVSGACEYWAMDHTISTGSNTQSPLNQNYASLADFEAAMCAMNPVPSTWYTATYVPEPNFCSLLAC